jgi:starch phosphorylase
MGSSIVQWKQTLCDHWQNIRFGDLRIDRESDNFTFRIHINLGGITPEQVSVELFAEGLNDSKPIQIKMESEPSIAGDQGYNFQCKVDSSRDPNDYTVRIIPCHEGVSVPLEMNYISWQR